MYSDETRYMGGPLLVIKEPKEFDYEIWDRMETSQRLQWPRIGIERERRKLEKRTMDGE